MELFMKMKDPCYNCAKKHKQEIADIGELDENTKEFLRSFLSGLVNTRIIHNLVMSDFSAACAFFDAGNQIQIKILVSNSKASKEKTDSGVAEAKKILDEFTFDSKWVN